MKNARRVMPRRGSSHSAEYEPLNVPGMPTELPAGVIVEDEYDEGSQDDDGAPFSWIDYGIFGFLGMAMLWAWNMFLAAAPYFESRFQGSDWIATNFQPTIMTASTATSLATVLVLTKIQRTASYPFRIATGLLINMCTFALLTASTTMALDASPRAYFAFVLTMVAGTSVATGLLQNGVLAFAAGFGRPEYMQSLVTGQSVAGILPALSEVLSVLLFPAHKDRSSGTNSRRMTPAEIAANEGKTSAFVYFLAAVVISVTAILALIPLVRHHKRNMEYRVVSQDDVAVDVPSSAAETNPHGPRKVVPMRVLFEKLRWLALGIALVFTTTMFFPVFTATIRSVQEPAEPWVGGLFAPDAFIPLAFFFWNLGDFSGRLSTALSPSSGLGANSAHGGRPKLLFKLAALRIVQLPLYLLCNIRGRGAAVPSDFFYLFVVQVPFGFTNGWLCARLMTSAGSWVDEGEREAAGGFMGLCLIVGLAAGSLLSFSAAGI